MDITEQITAAKARDAQVAALDIKAAAAFSRWFSATAGTREADTAWDEYEEHSNQARQLVNGPNAN